MSGTQGVWHRTSLYTASMKLLIRIAAVAAALLTSACTGTSVTGNWEDPRTQNAPYGNVLVVALLGHETTRLEMERQLTRELSAGGTRVTASMNLNDGLKNAPRTREEIIAMTEARKPDALLVLRVQDADLGLGKSKQEKSKYLFGGNDAVVGSKEATDEKKDGSWETRGELNVTDVLPDAKIQLYIDASLYDVNDEGRAVYTIELDTRYKNKGDNMIYELTSNTALAIGKELRAKGLVR